MAGQVRGIRVFPGSTHILPAAAVVCLFFLQAAPASAQRLNFQHYDSDDGLPQVQVQSIHRDRTGFLWVGTYGGISRYNGREFENFSTDHGLADNFVNAIAEDSEGRLWAGTGAGLCHFVTSQRRFECLDDNLVADVRINAMHSGPDGLWIGTDLGLARLEFEEGGGIDVRVASPELRGRDIRSLAALSGQEMLVGATDGLYRVDRHSGSARQIEFPNGGMRVTAIFPISDGAWIGTGTGLFKLDSTGLDRVALPEGLREADINDIERDLWERLWFVTDQGVLIHEDGGFRHLTTRHGLANNIGQVVFSDREGLVWIGQDDGLSKWIPGGFEGFSTEHGLVDSFVRTINQGLDGRLWLGTREGAQAVERKDGKWRFREALIIDRTSELPDDRVYSIGFRDSENALLATGAGLAQWRDGEGVVDVFTTEDGLPSNRIQAVFHESSDRTWIGTDLGTRVLEKGEVRKPSNLALSQAYVYRIRADAKGRIWFASQDRGLFILEPEGGMQRLDADDGLTDQTLWDLAPDEQGGMWIGSNGDGLFHVNADGGIQQFTTGNGLVNNFVWQVLVDSKGDVWTYTSDGISRLSDGSFRNYGRDDGLMHREGGATGAWETEDGLLWFASANGLMRFDRDREFVNNRPPHVVIDQVTVRGSSVPDGARLPYDAGNLNFNFSALTFQAESLVRFQYRLLGADDEWSDPIPYRPITFGGIGSGEYVFEVRARNPDGVWSREPARFEFTVLTPYWKTGWFMTVMVAVGLVLVFGGVWFRIRALEKKRLALKKLVSERTVELEQANQLLKDASITDPLTGLHNRRFLLDQIRADVAQSRRAYIGKRENPNRDIVFMMLDLDNFKEINDTYGHLAGDTVLKGYADTIRSQLRESDYVVRWGGEEFLVVARQTEAAHCNVIVERMIRAARRARFEVDNQDVPLTCTCSIGVSHFPFLRDKPDVVQWDQVVDVADTAVYMAKRLGRDGWVAIHAVPDAEVDDGGELLKRIKTDMRGLLDAGIIRLESSFQRPDTVLPGDGEER